VFVLSQLTTEHVRGILKRADKALCEDQGIQSLVSDEVIDYLADLADGDGIVSVDKVNDSKEWIEYVRTDILSGIDGTSEE
jgi:replication-associated recombination protein RarA